MENKEFYFQVGLLIFLKICKQTGGKNAPSVYDFHRSDYGTQHI